MLPAGSAGPQASRQADLFTQHGQLADIGQRVRPGGDNHLDGGHELVQEVLVAVEQLGVANRSAAVEQRQRTADPAGDPTRRSLSGVMVEAGSQPVGPGARAVVRTPCP